MAENKLLSLIVPVYNEEHVLSMFMKRVAEILKTIPDIEPEYIFINDGSTDRTLENLIALKATYPQIKIIDFSRNFGKEAALTAGLQYAKGDITIPIDVDLQDPPELIAEMVVK